MELDEIISPEAVLANLKPGSKKQLLQELANVAARMVKRDPQEVFETLLDRERLGSTGVGNGVAIPHGKIAGLERIMGVFARLPQPVDFDALDDQPVDIVFMLLAPEGSGADHLKALSRIARVLRNQATVSSIRKTDDPDGIFSLLTSQQNANAA
ncbi:MAG: PTS IIA-like nitrogen regulatory protein PtsN [Pseudomonadota bacterium]